MVQKVEGRRLKEKVLDYLACPECASELNLEILDKKDGEIKDGIFICKNCHGYYFLIDYIPRLLPADVVMKSNCYTNFAGKYRERLGQLNMALSKNESHFTEDDYQVRLKTIEYFGYEWKKFINWGWLEEDEIPEEDRIKYTGGFISDTVNAFKTKSLMDEDDLATGKLILDAGCGNGRFSNQAAEYGGEVLGVDIGTGAVESAYKNTIEKDNINMIQGDLLKLPFKKSIFDTAFSIGVLMHSGDAYQAFKSIANHIKTGGTFTTHVYHKLNPIWEINDFLLRKITTNMSVESNIKFANFMSKLGRLLLKMRLLYLANLFIRVQPTLHHMYDWYSAPVATHHTHDEVESWFSKNGFEISGTSKSESYPPFIKPWSITIKGRKLMEP
jgi:SAM-dependent methyltransferase/uncharacterized protein YbaR (Trm112 family)